MMRVRRQLGTALPIKDYANIVIMRHAETVWNAPRKRIQGQSPSDQIILSVKGKQEVVTAMAGIKIPDLLICSPLLRCKQTAEKWFDTSFEKIPIPTILMDDLKEVDAGQLEGLYVDELTNEPQRIWELWKNNPLQFPGFPGGETLADFQQRVLKAFAEICVQHGNQSKNIHVISHGGPLRVLKCFLENKDLSHLWDNEVSNLDKLSLTKDHIIQLQRYWQQHSYTAIHSSSKKPEAEKSLSTKNFPEKYTLGNSDNNKGNAIFIETEKFKVTIPRDNQLVPGILKLEPKHSELNDWDKWQDNDWEELLQLQRLIEFALIKAFDQRHPQLLPTKDNKLVNFFGRQIKSAHGKTVYFDIAPRYPRPIKWEVNNQTISFEDKLYGKPFDFANKQPISDNFYKELVKTLHKTIETTDFSKFNLEDDFSKKWDNCFSCKHPQKHPENVGLVQVGKKGSNITFSLNLNAHSQEEKGRTFCDSDLHIPALRYWEDERMSVVGELFKCYIPTINAIHPSPTGEREFDIAILMNLAKIPEGTHTHAHFIPRTPGSVDYGSNFQMDTKKYISLTKEKLERQKIVSSISTKLITEINKSNTLQILWPNLKDKVSDNHQIINYSRKPFR